MRAVSNPSELLVGVVVAVTLGVEVGVALAVSAAVELAVVVAGVDLWGSMPALLSTSQRHSNNNN